ncbi:PilZ domain-containing protein [Sphingomonas montana]|uniref:PilZ domain-containing protein n=1 Tax=Sphingomonas montana TaxID=1843236 RepID=UPI00096C609C|nr:PilZ domain-containing protein [Sphingomonas montana]
MSIAAKKEKAPSADRRQAARSDYGRTGTLRIADAPPVEVIVQDLNRDGCRIETSQRLVPNLGVAIGLAGVGIVEGKILWHGSQGYGCAFVNRLPAGSITAAFSPTNIRHLALSPSFPEPGDTYFPGAAVKWPIGHRVSAILLFSLGCWTIVVGTLLAIMR